METDLDQASAYPMLFTFQKKSKEERGKGEEEQVEEEDGEEEREKEEEDEERTYSISNNLLNTGTQASGHICISEVLPEHRMDFSSLTRAFHKGPLLVLTEDGPQNKPVPGQNHRKPDLQGEGMLEPRGMK